MGDVDEERMIDGLVPNRSVLGGEKIVGLRKGDSLWYRKFQKLNVELHR